MASFAKVPRGGSARAAVAAALVLMAGHAGRADGPTAAASSSGPAMSLATESPTRRALATVEAQPLTFERNIGQQPADFDYVATGQGYRVGLAATGATLASSTAARPRP